MSKWSGHFALAGTWSYQFYCLYWLFLDLAHFEASGPINLKAYVLLLSTLQDCPYNNNFFVSSFRFHGKTIVKSTDFFIFGSLVIFFRFGLWSYSLQKPHKTLWDLRSLFLNFLSANCCLSVLSQLRISILFRT